MRLLGMVHSKAYANKNDHIMVALISVGMYPKGYIAVSKGAVAIHCVVIFVTYRKWLFIKNLR
jgi:hypothetical protein